MLLSVAGERMGGTPASRGFLSWFLDETMLRRSLHVLVGLGSVVALAACGGAVGDKVRPKDFSGSGALGAVESCSGSPKLSKPFVVDLPSDARVDLEAAMKKSVVVVAYDCKSLQILSSCNLEDTSYDFAGVSRKEDVIQLKSADEVAVNLPLSGGKLGSEVSSGRSLDIATVLVGKKSTTVATVPRQRLSGPGCEGATHFIQSASIGAFSMATGSAGKVSAVGELFSVGAKGKSESSRKGMTSDGSLDSCRTSNPDAPKPPSECQAALRVELHPITADRKAEPGEKKHDKHDKHDKAPKDPKELAKEHEKEHKPITEDTESPCPAGFNYAGGVCTRSTNVARLCDFKVPGDCKAQCEKGSPESCVIFGNTLWGKIDPERAGAAEAQKTMLAAFKKACDLENGEGCAAYGSALEPQEENDPNAAAKFKEAVKWAQKGCDMGNGEACSTLGDMLTTNDPVLDEPAGTKAYERGCMLGHGLSCGLAAIQFLHGGKGVKKNPAKALALLDKSCQAGDDGNCSDLAELYFRGDHGVAKDTARAWRISSNACASDEFNCHLTLEIATALGKDEATLFRLANRACDGGDSDACLDVASRYDEGRGVAKDHAKAVAIWTEGCKDMEDEDYCKHVPSMKKKPVKKAKGDSVKKAPTPATPAPPTAAKAPKKK
jgi:uncharacterized protein